MSTTNRVAVKMKDIDGDIYVYNKDALLLRLDCGIATIGLEKFQLSASIGDGSPLVTLPDGQVVHVPWPYIIALAVLAASMASSQARTEPKEAP